MPHIMNTKHLLMYNLNTTWPNFQPKILELLQLIHNIFKLKIPNTTYYLHTYSNAFIQPKEIM